MVAGHGIRRSLADTTGVGRIVRGVVAGVIIRTAHVFGAIACFGTQHSAGHRSANRPNRAGCRAAYNGARNRTGAGAGIAAQIATTVGRYVYIIVVVANAMSDVAAGVAKGCASNRTDNGTDWSGHGGANDATGDCAAARTGYAAHGSICIMRVRHSRRRHSFVLHIVVKYVAHCSASIVVSVAHRPLHLLYGRGWNYRLSCCSHKLHRKQIPFHFFPNGKIL
jgi:hypothetical protein